MTNVVPLRRVVSDSEEMEVVSSSSSAENSPITFRSTPDLLLPMRHSLHETNNNNNNNNSTPNSQGGAINLLSIDKYLTAINPHPYLHMKNEEETSTSNLHTLRQEQEEIDTSAKIKPLHRSNHVMGFTNMLANSSLFPTRLVTTSSAYCQYDEDMEEDEMASMSSARSKNNVGCNEEDNNNGNDSSEFYNPLIALAPQRSFQSQRSTLSVHSTQSSRSTQSWGQLTEIDLPPKVNGASWVLLLSNHVENSYICLFLGFSARYGSTHLCT